MLKLRYFLLWLPKTRYKSMQHPTVPCCISLFYIAKKQYFCKLNSKLGTNFAENVSIYKQEACQKTELIPQYTSTQHSAKVYGYVP